MSKIDVPAESLILESAFQPLAAGMLSLVFLVGALRVNIVFVLVFFTVTIGFFTLSASFWKMGLGEMVLYERLLQVSRASINIPWALLTSTLSGDWWLLVRYFASRLVLALRASYGCCRLHVAIASRRSIGLLGETRED